VPGVSSRARLADIAAKAGVSEATVSRVLNGKPGVADDTKQSVLTALDVLGFERPSRLRRRSAGLIGLVMPELINPIFPAFAQVIESALSQRGYTPVLCTQSPSGATEEEYVEMLLERGALHLQREAHVVGDRHVRVQRVVLEHHRDVPLLRRTVRDVAVADVDRTLVDLFEAGEHPERGGLTTTRRADEHHELAVLDLEVELVDGGRVRTGVDPGRRLERNSSHDDFFPSPAGTCRTIRVKAPPRRGSPPILAWPARPDKVCGV